MTNEDRHADEALERSLSAMRDAPIPDGPPAKLVADTLAALRGAAGEDTPRRLIANTLITRITTMRFVTKLAAAMLLAAGVTLLAVLTLRPTSVAWADVVAKVADAKALSFRTTTPLPGTDKTMTQRFLMAGDGRQRIETGDDQVTIIDAKAGVETSLDLKAKKAHVLRSKAHAYGFANDPLASLKEMRGKDAKEIGQKEIDGRKVKGFACTAGKAEYVVWADAKGGDPVRVEWSLLLPQGKTTMVMDDFKIEQKVDEALLDATPPKGYEVIEVPGGDEPAATTKPGNATTKKAADVATSTAADVEAAEDKSEADR
jgi:outer membrane lipoprotein-sorting protein